ncbi:MAG: hypothetical protein IKS87_02050 [Lachnospiraceae bacterium]|nr:hypothetical protein [Lachnospiraceae bacterium]
MAVPIVALNGPEGYLDVSMSFQAAIMVMGETAKKVMERTKNVTKKG